MSAPAHVCLVTSGHLATNPRLVKEADALTGAGYRVSIVSARYVDWADRGDAEFEHRPWQRRVVAFGRRAGRVTWLRQSLAQRTANVLDHLGVPPRRAWRDRAQHPVAGDLIRAARRVRADLYIGHNMPGLVAAGYAAQAHRARLGFDAEDDHVGELPDDASSARERARRQAIHAYWLPRCTHLTTAAPMMAAALQARYGLAFAVLHNVFDPLADESLQDDREAGLYWLSQTLGPGRGLESLLAVMGAMRVPVALTVRGRDTGHGAHLRAAAAAHGIAPERLAVLDPIAPGAITASCAPYSLGLSVEVPNEDNRRVCLGNKIFHYLAAGIPVALSRTPAQDAMAGELGDAAVSIALDDVPAAAATLDRWFGDSRKRAAARAAARAARLRWTWATEQRLFLSSVAKALQAPAAC